ncbi:Beta-lactamase OXY-1 precursor [Afipia felis]|uniref:Beta-lactamase n=1 Tax=Afipia felis TaxID=1035 RepID=A0A090MSH8_AFIFE|nr:class A beta-lactamase [Afipia felis]CEG08584.1 Beta-lactamase OXY-1 precursor [Afipia felis]
MTTRRIFLFGTTALLGVGCSGSVALARPLQDLKSKISRIESRVKGRLGVAVLDTGSDRRFGYRKDERFPMCSTFKLMAAAAILKRVEQGQETLERRVHFSQSDLVTYSPATEKHLESGMTVAELCEAAITLSDNTAGNLMLGMLGGPPGVTAFARALGDPLTRLDRTELALNEAVPGDPRGTTTPAAMAEDLRKLMFGGALAKASSEQLKAWLLANKTGDARLRARLPAGWRVGDKTGSGERGSTNDVGILWPPDAAPLIAAVYLTQTAASMNERNEALAAVGEAVAAAFRGHS